LMKSLRSEQVVFAGIFILGVSILAGVQAVSRWDARPNTAQRIRAQLVTWGLPVQGIDAAVDPAEVDRQVSFLLSDISEQRVQAARWLARRGVRSATDEIASSMQAAGTLRPCQLAHSLGKLGDERYVDTLADAVRQPSNTDLRVCATMALGELASPRAVTALIEAYHDRITPTTALIGLGNIAHPSAVAFLQQVVDQPRNERERHAAATALEKIRIMERPDPVPTLIERVRAGVTEQESLDHWALRKLAEHSDPRTPPAVRQLLIDAKALSERDLVAAAAMLVAHAEPGRAVLADLRQSSSVDEGMQSVTLAALRLISRDRP